MLVTERLGARFRIDSELANETSTMEAAVDRIIRAVIAAGDQRAYKIREESVYVGEPIRDNSRMWFTLDAVWSPLSAVLVGGEYDGDRINVRRENGGLLPQTITLPYRASPLFDAATAPSPLAYSNPSYHRSGIDPIADEWVYTLAR